MAQYISLLALVVEKKVSAIPGTFGMTELLNELVARATSMRALLGEHATKAESERRLTDEVDAALTESGFSGC